MSGADKESLSAEADYAADGDEDVGYCKPPTHTQFKKGNTFGKGRPKGAKNLKTIVNEAMNQKVPVKIGGKTKKLSKVALTVHQLATKASQGDLKAAEKVLFLYERYGPQEDPDGPAPDKVSKDFEALREYVAMQDQIYPPNEKKEEGNG